MLDRLFDRHDVREREERSLEDCVRAFAHADFDGEVDGINRVELYVVLCDVLLCLCVEFLGEFRLIPLAVDEEYTAGLDVVDDAVGLLDVGRVVACDKVSLVDIVGTLYLIVTETEV